MSKDVICIPATKTIMGNEPSQILNVAAYCRVSNQSDEQYGSLEVQKSYYPDYINDNPLWKNVGEISKALQKKYNVPVISDHDGGNLS